jgi:hypothetical protein
MYANWNTLNELRRLNGDDVVHLFIQPTGDAGILAVTALGDDAWALARATEVVPHRGHALHCCDAAGLERALARLVELRYRVVLCDENRPSPHGWAVAETSVEA